MKQMTELEIANRLRLKKPFFVKTSQERQKVLDGAKYIGVKVATRQLSNPDGFAVAFLETAQ